MRAFTVVSLFVLTLLGMSLGVIAGTVALASVITESAARASLAGADRFADRFHLSRISPQLRDDLARLLATDTPKDGTR